VRVCLRVCVCVCIYIYIPTHTYIPPSRAVSKTRFALGCGSSSRAVRLTRVGSGGRDRRVGGDGVRERRVRDRREPCYVTFQHFEVWCACVRVREC